MTFVRTNNYLFFLLILNFIFASSRSIAQHKGPYPEWIKRVDPGNAAVTSRNEVKDGYYYALVDEQYNAVLQSNFFHYAICALNEEALTSVSQLEFGYDPDYQKAILHSVKVHRNGYVIDKTSEVNLKKLNEESERSSGILNGRVTLYANLTDIRKGDIVEYSFSVIGQNPAQKNYLDHSFSTTYSIPVGRIYLRLILPQGLKPAIAYNNGNYTPQVIQGSNTEYIWDILKPEVKRMETSVPEWYDPFGKILISSFRDWQEVKSHCISLFEVKTGNDKRIETLLDSIKRLHSEDKDRISAIVDFVQTSIRYSGNEGGIYSHVPRPADVVIKNRFGDCKEKTLLLITLLRKIGIQAYPVLLNTYQKKHVMDYLPSMYAFNHAVVTFEYRGERYFLDPTISSQRGAFMFRTFPSYELGMVLKEEGEPFIDIPDNQASLTSIYEDFIIEPSGDTRLVVKTVLTGLTADNFRYLFLTSSISDIQESYRAFYTKFNPEVKVLDTIKTEENKETGELIFHEHYLLPGFWKPEDSTKSKSITKDFIPYSLYNRLNFAESPSRKDPLLVEYPMRYHQVMTISNPNGWSVKNDLKESNNTFFRYSFKTEVNSGIVGGTVRLIYNYEARKKEINPSEYKAYQTEMEFINQNMVFTSVYTPSLANSKTFNWSLFLALFAGLTAGIILAIYLYRKKHVSSYTRQYDTIGGWLILIGISLVVNPFLLLISFFRMYIPEMKYDYYELFLTVNSDFFSPLKGCYFLIMPVFNVIFLVVSVLLIVLFFQKKALFRPVFCIFRIVNTVILFIDVIVLHVIYSGTTDISERQLLSNETNQLIKVFVGVMIWVPYIWYSERSRHTFTNPEPEKVTLDNSVTQSSSHLPSAPSEGGV